MFSPIRNFISAHPKPLKRVFRMYINQYLQKYTVICRIQIFNVNDFVSDRFDICQCFHRNSYSAESRGIHQTSTWMDILAEHCGVIVDFLIKKSLKYFSAKILQKFRKITPCRNLSQCLRNKRNTSTRNNSLSVKYQQVYTNTLTAISKSVFVKLRYI